VAPLELRPRSVTEIVDVSFQQMRQNYLPLVTLALAAQIPLVMMRIGGARMGLLPERVGALPTGWFGMTGATITFLVAAFLVLLVITLVLQAAITSAASEGYLGHAVVPAAAVGRATSRIWTIIGAGLTLAVFVGGIALAFAVLIPVFAALKLGGLATGLLGVACFALFIYAAFRIAVLYPVVMIESNGPVQSISRTWSLGAGHVWHIFLTILLAFIIYVGVFMVVVFVVSMLGGIITPLADMNFQAILQSAGSALVQPFFAVATVVLYYDLRIRKEGFDLDMMSQRLGASGASGAAPAR
jgi:hypothetical protein